ncbi:MAG: hexose kinase [Granulosicoccus sp.]
MRILSICLNPAVDVSSEAQEVFPSRKIRTRNERIEPGGGGVNVARVLASFGLSCQLLYFSGGTTGVLLDEKLATLGIYGKRFNIDASTRIAFNVHQISSNQEFRFVPEGPKVSPDALAQVLTYIESIPLNKDDIVVASGSLPQGLPLTAYANIADMAKNRKAKFILDSSGVGLSSTLSNSHVYLVKPSLGELKRLAGGVMLDESAARQVALDLVSSGHADNVAVSMGSHGAFLATTNGVLRLPAHLVKLKSAVGAGDSFVGAMVFYLAQGHSIEQAFRFGVAAGAAAVMTPGTELCRRDDVIELFNRSHSSSEHKDLHDKAIRHG